MMWDLIVAQARLSANYGQEVGRERVVEISVLLILLLVGALRVNSERRHLTCRRITGPDLRPGAHQPVESIVEPVVAFMSAAQAGLQDLMDGLRLMSFHDWASSWL